MPKYLCIQRSGSEGKQMAPPSPAQMQEMYSKFRDWMERFKDQLVDPGGKLGSGGFVTSEGSTDGPLVETKEVIGGYMIISAENLEQALEIARLSPGVAMPGCSVEVREIRGA